MATSGTRPNRVRRQAKVSNASGLGDIGAPSAASGADLLTEDDLRKYCSTATPEEIEAAFKQHGRSQNAQAEIVNELYAMCDARCVPLLSRPLSVYPVPPSVYPRRAPAR